MERFLIPILRLKVQPREVPVQGIGHMDAYYGWCDELFSCRVAQERARKSFLAL
jgi:hypothetical protein